MWPPKGNHMGLPLQRKIMEQIIFYILAAATVIATVFSITERHAVHAIVYLVTSFFALAVIFYLLGAPLVAVFEVIIYAGAIMVLFMFVIMMLDLGHPEKVGTPGIRDWWPALVLAGVVFAAIVTIVAAATGSPAAGQAIGVREFALVLFQRYGVAIEIISMQLLFALVGALYLGRRQGKGEKP
ncbi:MAG: NADH-quinone oxidoreductase subunit [Geobacteraceae bacterium]|nr:MAG: NADH-quinone oxidoreductase subunit [Geobacteraceae bacterium]